MRRSRMGKGCCRHDGDVCSAHGLLECGAVVDGVCPFSGNAAEQAVYCSSYSQDESGCKTAEAWEDVKRKGELIYSRGGVTNLRESPVEIDATVRSDMLRGERGVRVDKGGPYEVTLSKRSWENKSNVGGYVQGFLCECEWGQYHSGQPGPGWGGRLCSHAYATALASGARFRQDFMRNHESSRLSSTGLKPYTCADEMFSDVVDATYCGDEGAIGRLSAMGRDVVGDMRRGMRLRRANRDECVATWGGLSRKVATRRISADEMRELEHEIDGKELRNRGKLKMQAPDAATDDDFLWM